MWVSHRRRIVVARRGSRAPDVMAREWERACRLGRFRIGPGVRLFFGRRGCRLGRRRRCWRRRRGSPPPPSGSRLRRRRRRGGRRRRGRRRRGDRRDRRGLAAPAASLRPERWTGDAGGRADAGSPAGGRGASAPSKRRSQPRRRPARPCKGGGGRCSAPRGRRAGGSSACSACARRPARARWSPEGLVLCARRACAPAGRRMPARGPRPASAHARPAPSPPREPAARGPHRARRRPRRPPPLRWQRRCPP